LNTVVMLTVLAAALALAIGVAFLPMRLLLTHIAANIQQFIVRAAERRVLVRQTPVRRKERENPDAPPV
jgi:hypothetical protein